MSKYENILYTSRTVLSEAVKTGRLHLTLAENTNLPYNTVMNRLDPKMWIIDYNALMVATIIPMGTYSFKVPAQWRTNSDFLGVRWQSDDKFNHDYFKFATDNNYTGMVVAFRANPAEPNKFTVTLYEDGLPRTYRLSPYALSSATGKYECLDTEYGTKQSYPANIIRAVDVAIPTDALEEFKGRKDYIYIMDMGDLRTTNSYVGPKIKPNNITMISFDCVEASHGLGKTAYLSRMTQLPNNEIQMELGGCYTNAVLSAGDKLQAIWRWYAEGTTAQFYREDEFVVKRYSGFGTSALTVIVEGTMPGIFAGCDAFYGRYLAIGVPSGVTDSTKYFYDFTMTGGKQTVGKRRYVQKVNGQGMTSGFDDGYNLTPERQVDMTYDLGYRDFWTCYVGMSHYFSGRTVFQHKVTGEKVVESDVLEFPILYAGQSNAAIHFVAGLAPNRGVDSFQQKLVDLFGVNYGAVEEINGAIGSTAADRMSSPNPDSVIFDPLQTASAGGLWWWDLESDTPGPTLLNCIEQVGERIPKAIIWSQGEQDASAIAFPGGRNPAPSVARSKLATEKTFAYFRNLWPNVPILIQEQGMGWGIPIPSQPQVPTQRGQPTYLDAKRNTWGDLVLTWLSYGDNPVNYSYRVDIFHPSFPTQIIRSITVPGTQIHGGLITCDYPVELNIPDAIAVYGDQYPWGYLIWQVTRTDNPLVTSAQTQTVVPIDDDSFVKKTAVFGINAGTGNYFTDYSDTTKPGGLSIVGRKDKSACSSFRRTLAVSLGLRDVEVMPVNVAKAQSPLNPMPYQPDWQVTDYWWDPVNGVPGPNLLAADEIVKTLGRVPDYFIESGPGEVFGMQYTAEANWPGIVANFKASNIQMLAWMRDNWDNPDLSVWFQGATTSWYGAIAPPKEMSWKQAYLVRTAQQELARMGAGFRIGSYVPLAWDWTKYRNEGGSWTNFITQSYHDMAIEMAQSIAANNNLALQEDPVWTTLRPPSNLKVRRKVNSDIVMTWDSRPEATQFHTLNMSANDLRVFQEGFPEVPSWTFTVADQITAYNQLASYVAFAVGEWKANGNIDGPQIRYEDFVVEGDPSFNAITTLAATYVGPPVEIPMGGGALYPRDILFTWTAPADGLTYWIKNRRVDVALVNMASEEIAGNSYLFTVAQQQMNYGYGASVIDFDVSKYDPVHQIRGPIAVITGPPGNP